MRSVHISAHINMYFYMIPMVSNGTAVRNCGPKDSNLLPSEKWFKNSDLGTWDIVRHVRCIPWIWPEFDLCISYGRRNSPAISQCRSRNTFREPTLDVDPQTKPLKIQTQIFILNLKLYHKNILPFIKYLEIF